MFLLDLSLKMLLLNYRINYDHFDECHTSTYLFSPSMRTVWIGAYVVKSHFFFSASCLGLKENGFPVATFWASVVFGAR